MQSIYCSPIIIHFDSNRISIVEVWQHKLLKSVLGRLLASFHVLNLSLLHGLPLLRNSPFIALLPPLLTLGHFRVVPLQNCDALFLKPRVVLLEYFLNPIVIFKMTLLGIS